MAEYIEKRAAIEYLMINMGWYDEDGRSVHDAEEKRGIITDLIDGIPLADVRPVVRGRWIRKHDDVCYWSECSICGEYPPKNRYGQEWLSDFCPNCGADMRGEDNE